MSSNFCAHFDNKAWLIGHFWAWHIIPHFLYHACMHHTKHQVKNLMPNLFPKVKKYGRPMGSSNWCHRKIQEEFGHDIRKIKEQLARLKSLLEDMAVRPRGPSPSPNQQVPRPFVQTMSHLPRGTDRPNLRQSMHTAPPSFVTMSRPINQPSSSRGKPSGQKAARRRKSQ